MSAEILRQAATAIRAEQDREEILGHISEREFNAWAAVADLLDATVSRDDFCPATSPADCHVSDCLWHCALAIADAYLGESE